MPTYDYECQDCGHTFELFQSINAAVETTCPKCQKETLKRLIGTGAAVVFKGSGFYQTDYRSDGYKKSAAADSKTGQSGKSTSGSDQASGAASQAASSEKSSSGSSSTESSTSSATPKKSDGGSSTTS